MITRFSAAALVAAAASLTPNAVTAAASPFAIVHHERMAGLSLERRAATQELGRHGHAARLRFQALGRAFDLALEPNDRLVANLESGQRLALGAIELYRGSLYGRPGSWARVSLRGGEIYGLIFDGEELYAIEPAARLHGRLVEPAANPEESIVFRVRDVQGDFADETPLAAGTTATAYDALASELQSSPSASPARRLDLGLVADFEFSLRHGDPESELLLRANAVDGIFSEQLGLQINVAHMLVHARAEDAFATTDPTALLEATGALRADSATLRAQALTHLFTGRELDGTTVGLAYVGTVCGPATGVGLTEAGDSVFRDALVAAHEIGHNLGARHDAEAGSPCESTPPTYLMAPQLSGSDQFSACSVENMSATILRAACLGPAHAGDVRVTLSGAGTALLGDDVPVQLLLENLGTEASANVLLTFRAGDGAEIVRLPGAADQDCAVTDGELRCTVGEFPAGAREAFTLELRGTRTGLLSLQGSAYASNDTNPANNLAVHALGFEPAVVLAVGVQPEALALAAGEAAAVEITVANDSVLTATGVLIDISSPFEIPDLAFAEGSCERTANAAPRYRCAVGTLASGASRRLHGTIHAPAELPEGQPSSGLLSATATAAEPIARAGTNSASAVVQAFAAVADLEAVVVSAPARVAAGASAHLVVRLRSLGPDAAPRAQLRIELPPQLVLVEVADERAACGADGANAVRCTLASLGGSEAVEVEIDVRAQRAGAYAWTVSASHDGLDPNGANDRSERSLEVTAPPAAAPAASGDGGGGGGASWLLAALAALGLGRRRAHAEQLAAAGRPAGLAAGQPCGPDAADDRG